MFRFWKTAKAVANLFMLYLSWRWLTHGLGVEVGVGCIVLSFMWLGLTFGQMHFLMRSYATRLSQLQMHLPLWFGVGLCLTALLTTHYLYVQVLAAAGLVGWVYVYLYYRAQKKLFEKRSQGYLPRGIMINPPAEMLPPGTILLMTGDIAGTIGEEVGHGEIVIPDGDKKWAFSTYMKYGVVLNPLEEVLSRRAKRGITVARVPVVPWTPEDCKHSLLQARAMQRQNKEHVVRARRRREKRIAALPLPAVAKRKIEALLPPITGYDWFGLVLGRMKMNTWTCIGSVQELLWRMGKTLDRYFGTGILGAGTTILDPIVPARFFELRCYRDLTEADHQAWLASKSA